TGSEMTARYDGNTSSRPPGVLFGVVRAWTTRIAPFDERDEQSQDLERNLARQPVLLTRVGTNPLMVSLIRQSRRAAIQLDEATAELALYQPSQ
ncbi:MAG: hypothetical protein KDI09_15515, partial [Halioglobus sp.]|nr:hypothetical protein [Halioglobus sp.]